MLIIAIRHLLTVLGPGSWASYWFRLSSPLWQSRVHLSSATIRNFIMADAADASPPDGIL